MFSHRTSSSLALLFLLAFVAGWLATTARAQDQPTPAPAQTPTSIGTVTPGAGGRALFPIAIPAFKASGAVSVDLARIVLNDLDLSGFFDTKINEQFVRETNQLDLSQNNINYAEWKRIGALYLVKGEVALQGDKLVVTVKTYDTAQQAYIFGREYRDYTAAEGRTVAHLISNDLIERLTGNKGVANTKILFVRGSDPHGKVKNICIMDADGFGVKALTGNELAVTPAWGAHGAEIYYTTYKDFNPDLAGMILRSGATWWVSRRGGFNISPSWSEKQQLIALTLSKDGNSEIYTMNREGKNLRRMTVNKAIDSSPCWSPDGSQIAFTSDRGGNPQIYVMDAGSQGVRRLSYGSTYCDSADWAPTGSNRIAYAARINGDFQIFTVNPDGTDPRQLTQTGNNEDPSWSPNGWTLSFTSDRDGARQIYTMFADGSQVRKLTNGAPTQSSAWSPAMP